MKKLLSLCFAPIVFMLSLAQANENLGHLIQIPDQPFAMSVVGEDGNPIRQIRNGYVALRHGEHYTLRFTNRADVRAAIAIMMDGTPWESRIVIDPNTTAEVETIPGTGKRLTFFAKESKEANKAYLSSVSASNMGLISASFMPEKPTPKVETSGEYRVMGEVAGLGAGGTGLTGKSSQQFSQVSFEDDPSVAPVVLHVRLVALKPAPEPDDVTPIPGRKAPVEMAVPPPIQ